MEIFEEVARMVGVSAALTTALTILVGVAYRSGRFIYRTAKYAEHVHDTVEKMDAMVENQLTNNVGDSMLDMVQEIRRTVRSLDERVTVLESR